MNEEDHWIYLDGPEPESVRELLETLRDVPPPTADESARLERDFLARLAAKLGGLPASLDWRGGEPAAPPLVVTAAEAPSDRPVVVPARLASPLLVAQPAEAPIEPVAVDGDAASPPPRPAGGAPAPPALVRTALALELPPEAREALGRLPFQPAASSPPAPVPSVNKTQATPVMRSIGATFPIGSEALFKMVAALPFSGSPGAAAVVPYPDLSGQQYASLRAELAVHPHLSAEILPRYDVHSQPSLAALDEHWRQHLAEHPDEQAALAADYDRFTQYLRLQRR